MIDWLYSFREETKQIIERTNQLKKENEILRKEIEALRSITPEKITEIVTKSMSEDTPRTGTRALENRCPLWYDTLIDELQDD